MNTETSLNVKTQTGAEVLVAQMVARNVRRIYGVPGGDCSLDIIAAAKEAGIEFVLAATGNSAAMMACAEAEITGTLGVVLTTRGPGVANAANGVAYAQLDRIALLLVADTYENNQSYVSHQRFDQIAMLEPVTKGTLRLDDATALPAIGPLLDLALSGRQGAVYLEVTGSSMRSTVSTRPPITSSCAHCVAERHRERVPARPDFSPGRWQHFTRSAAPGADLAEKLAA